MDSEKAKIAQYMVELGFRYLERINPHYIAKLAYRVMDEAVEISKYLTAISLPEEERGLFGAWVDPGGPIRLEHEEEEE